MSFTVIIIIVTVLVSMAGWKNPELQNKLMMNPYSFANKGQFYRLISSGFVHANWTHLGFNMFTFYFFGSLIEQLYTYMLGANGGFYYLGLYILGIIISDIPSILKYKDVPHYNSLGASGGVSAVVFSSIMFLPTNPICLYGILCIPGFILGTIYLIYSYYEGKRMADNVNHNAHLIGAVFGIIYSIYLQPTVILEFFEAVVNYKFF
jgi:membrane associated rhomboid family serine protease